MAEVTYACTACRKTLTVDDGLVGQDVACPACAHVMTVPRVRAPLAVKGRDGARRGTPPQAQAANENLSGLSEVDAFGGEREQLVVRRRRWQLAWQILAAVGMLATIVVVVYAGYRFFDARESRKRQAAEAFLRQEQRQELRRRQRIEARQLNAAARQQHAGWSLSDDACYRLWRALNTRCSVRQDAQARFDFWVSCDAGTHGLFSEVFGGLKSPADIEAACQRLAGFSLGLQGDPARLPPLAEFRALARLSLDAAE